MKPEYNEKDEEKDLYPIRDLVPLKKKEFTSKIIQKPTIQWEQFFQPIPSTLFFQHQEQLSNGINLYRTQPPANKEEKVNFLCFHGAGHSALVFGQLAKELRQESSLFAYDLSGHGASKKCESVEELKIEKLVEEGVHVFQDILVKYPGKYVFIGHSLGGSIASQVAEKVNAEEILGVVMIDTIEGAAMKSESSMVEFLTERPKQFRSIQSAINWNVKAGCVRRVQAARFSIPSQMSKNGEKYEWKVDLLSTKPLWRDWFSGLSQKFLRLKCQKLLLTTSKFRLDETLLIGLEKGEFDLHLFDHSGHNIQEDEYEKVARILIGKFLQE